MIADGLQEEKKQRVRGYMAGSEIKPALSGLPQDRVPHGTKTNVEAWPEAKCWPLGKGQNEHNVALSDLAMKSVRKKVC